MSDSINDGRTPIPADLRRRVLVEAGHRCAIPTCRHIEVDVHHIVPWSQCKAHDYDNLIAVCPNCHRRAHRGEIDRKSLRLYKINLRFIHEKYSQLEMDILFELARLPASEGLNWPPMNHILLKRILESGYVLVHKQESSILFGNVQISPDVLSITPKGRQFINDLGITEL